MMGWWLVVGGGVGVGELDMTVGGWRVGEWDMTVGGWWLVSGI